MVAKLASYALILGCSAISAEQPSSAVAQSSAAGVHVYAQRPLPIQPASVALVFMGGFGDEISGIVEYVERVLPPIREQELRAYYHWNGGVPADADQGCAAVAGHIEQFRRLNPQADVVLIGHSMGAAAALKVAHLLAMPAESQGRVLLITLDPSDRSVKPNRPASLHWWGNCYVVQSQSDHDFIAVWGGRWNHCEAADVNICYNGLRTDEFGYYFIHDNALSLLMSQRGTPAQSLYGLLKAQLAGSVKQSEQPEAKRQQGN